MGRRRLTMCALLMLIGPRLPAPLDSTAVDITAAGNDHDNPALAWNGTDEWLVVFVWDQPDNLGPGPLGIWGLRMPTFGSPGEPFLIREANAAHPAVHYSSNSDLYLVAWEENSDVQGQRVAGEAGGGDGGSEFVGGLIDLSDGFAAAARESLPRIAFNTEDNDFFVVFVVSDVLFRGRVWSQRVRASTGARVGILRQVSDDSDAYTNPAADYSPSDDAYLVAWEQTRGWARRVNRDGTMKSDLFHLEDAGVVTAGHPRVAYAVGLNRYLVAYRLGSEMRVRALPGTDPGAGGNQFLNDPQVIPNAGSASNIDVVFANRMGGWFVIWDGAAPPWEVRAAWVDGDGVPFSAFPVTNYGEAPALPTHVAGVGNLRAIWTELTPNPPFASSNHVIRRNYPEAVAFGRGDGSTTTVDFVSGFVQDGAWNFYYYLPGEDRSGVERLYSDLYQTELAHSSAPGSDNVPAIVAVDGALAAVTSPRVMLSVAGLTPPPADENPFVDGRVFSIGVHSAPDAIRGSTAGLDEFPMQGYALSAAGGQSYVVSAIPADPNVRLGAAVFDSDAGAPSSAYQGIADAIAVRGPSANIPGASLTFNLMAADTVGLVVFATQGLSEYDVIYREADQCTSEEIIAYLLGLIPEPPGAEVNGLAPIDVADVVAAVNLGR